MLCARIPKDDATTGIRRARDRVQSCVGWILFSSIQNYNLAIINWPLSQGRFNWAALCILFWYKESRNPCHCLNRCNVKCFQKVSSVVNLLISGSRLFQTCSTMLCGLLCIENNLDLRDVDHPFVIVIRILNIHNFHLIFWFDLGCCHSKQFSSLVRQTRKIVEEARTSLQTFTVDQMKRFLVSYRWMVHYLCACASWTVSLAHIVKSKDRLFLHSGE